MGRQGDRPTGWAGDRAVPDPASFFGPSMAHLDERAGSLEADQTYPPTAPGSTRDVRWQGAPERLLEPGAWDGRLPHHLDAEVAGARNGFSGRGR